MSRWRVLIVDDEAEIRDVLSEYLEGRGHHVDTAASGREAIQAIETTPVTYDLALVDWTMPGISGRDVLAEIARRSPNTRLLVATGKVEGVQLPGAAGASIRVLHKPFTFREMVTAMTEAINDVSLSPE